MLHQHPRETLHALLLVQRVIANQDQSHGWLPPQFHPLRPATLRANARPGPRPLAFSPDPGTPPRTHPLPRGRAPTASSQGVPQIANIVEGGGQTPVLPPDELYRLGFMMAIYPTTVLFRVARTIEKALADLKTGNAMSGDSVDFTAFKDITRYGDWARIDDTHKPPERSEPR